MRAAAAVLIAVCVTMATAATPVGSALQSGSTAALRVAVVTSNGSPVRGLTRDDFIVRLDNVPVEVRSVRVDDPLPVLVLVDVTASAGSADALRGLIGRDVRGALAPGTPVRVAAIGRTLHAPGDWASERRAQDAQLRQALTVKEEDRHGPSPVWDALNESLQTLLPADGRAGILLVTDGQTTGNRVRLAVPADRAMALGVPVSVVFTGSVGRLSQQGEVTAVVRPDRPLEQLAVATGGAFFNRSAVQRREWDSGPGGDPLRRAALSLTEAYVLEVAIPAKPGFQRVSVTTRDAAHVVRVRMGILTK